MDHLFMQYGFQLKQTGNAIKPSVTITGLYQGRPVRISLVHARDKEYSTVELNLKAMSDHILVFSKRNVFSRMAGFGSSADDEKLEKQFAIEADSARIFTNSHVQQLLLETRMRKSVKSIIKQGQSEILLTCKDLFSHEEDVQAALDIVSTIASCLETAKPLDEEFDSAEREYSLKTTRTNES